MTTTVRVLPLHPQVYSPIVGAEVDEGMVDMLEWLTVQGFKTEFSCQGVEPCRDEPEGTRAYVAISDPDMSLVRVLREHARGMEVEIFYKQDRTVIVLRMPRDGINQILDSWRVAFGD